MDHTEITIRPAVAADAEAVFQLVRSLAAYEELSDSVVATERDIARMLSEPRGLRAVIAETRRGPAGLLTFFLSYSTFNGKSRFYVEDLFVSEEYRGKGIGRMLMEWAAAAALKQGCESMAWLVLDWNQSARGFYERLGAYATPWISYCLDYPELARLGGAKEDDIS